MPSPLINSQGWFLQRNSFNYFKGWKRGQWLIRWDDPHISSNEQYFVLESSRSDNFLLEIQKDEIVPYLWSEVDFSYQIEDEGLVKDLTEREYILFIAARKIAEQIRENWEEFLPTDEILRNSDCPGKHKTKWTNLYKID